MLFHLDKIEMRTLSLLGVLGAVCFVLLAM